MRLGSILIKIAHSYFAKAPVLFSLLFFPSASQAETSWNACSLSGLKISSVSSFSSGNGPQKPLSLLSARVLCGAPVYEIRVTVDCASKSEAINFNSTTKQTNWDIWITSFGTAECKVYSEGLS
jgi:hypothetical protein